MREKGHPQGVPLRSAKFNSKKILKISKILKIVFRQNSWNTAAKKKVPPLN